MSPIKRALVSVSDKTNIAEFAKQLHQRGVEILSTGGTAELMKKNGVPVTLISDYTGFPEMMDGRIKPCIRKCTAEFSDDAMFRHTWKPCNNTPSTLSIWW